MTNPINDVMMAPSLNKEIKALVAPSLPLDLWCRMGRKVGKREREKEGGKRGRTEGRKGGGKEGGKGGGKD